MSSERIRGLSIGLNLDDSNIDRKLGSIKRSFKDLNGSLKTNMNNFKYTEKSVKSYGQVMEDLTGAIDGQQKNVDDLKSRYDELVESGKSHTAEASKVRQEYNKQADNLNRLQHELENAKDGMHQLHVEQSKFTQWGNNFKQIGSNVQAVGGQIQNVGGNMTRWITAPIMGAITAAGGLTAAFGWGRLVGLDSAKAQLEGLGYSLEEVDSITGEVSDAIQGGMMTMAEGTSTAAGAMAAGVEQGDELARYLQLVDAAAVGANRPVGEMAQIFNRVQGSGKLMTEELNRVEDGMPGFSLAMAEHMGVGLEEFRKMVTEGQVQTDDFMDVMEDFAGGMAEAQSKSWSGMLQNTKAWIGILGENLLSGVFEQSKESIAEFIELLKSDAAQEWASEMGEKIGSTFSSIVDHIKGAINWFMDLDTEQKKLIGTIAGIVVAAGPFLTIFGGLTVVFGKVISALAPVFLGLGKLSGGLKIVMSGVKPFAAVFPKLAGLITLITGPIGWTVAGLTALTAGFVLAYNKSETFRNFIQQLKERFIEFIPTIINFGNSIKNQFMGLVVPAFQAVRDFGIEMFQKIKQFWQSDGEQTFQAFMNIISAIQSAVSFAMPYIQTTITVAFKIVLSVIKMIWENIKGVINGGLNVIMGLVRVFTGIFTGNFSKMWEGVKQIFSGAIQAVWNGFQLLFWGRIIRGVGSLVRAFSGSIRGLWQNVVSFFQGMYQGAVQRVGSLRSSVTNIGDRLSSGFSNIISRMVTAILGFFRNLFTRGRNLISDLRSAVTSRIGLMRDGAINGVRNMRDRIVDFFTRIKNRGTSLFDDLVEGARKLPGRIGTAIKNMASKAVDGAIAMGNSIAEKLESVVNKVVGGLNSILNAIGMDDPIKEISIGRFSTGTNTSHGQGRVGAGGNMATFSTGTMNGKIARDMLGILNDKGPGNGFGGATQEVISRDGKILAPQGEDALVELKKNDSILSGAETQSLMSAGVLPRFSKGSGTEGGDSGNKGLWSSFKDLVGDIWSYITDPAEAFKALMTTVTPDFGSFSGFPGHFLTGGFEFLTDGVETFIKNIFKENEGALGTGKKYAWMNYPMSTPYSPNKPVPGYPTSFNKGHHYGVDYVTPVGTTVRAPMAGQLSSFRNRGGGLIAKLVTGQLRQFWMHMSSVAKAGTVGPGDIIGRTGNSGEWTYGPGHVHYQAQQGTDILNRGTINPLSVIEGHRLGGRTLTDGLFNLHGGEYIINPENPSEAMKLLALAGKELAGKSKQTRQLPNPSNYNDDNSQSEIINLLTKQNQILMKLLDKNTDIYMSDEKVGSMLDERDAVNAAVQF